MAKHRAEMDRLKALEDQLRQQIEALQNELKGVEKAIRAFQGEDLTQATSEAPRRRMRNVKDIVIRLLQTAGPKGLTAVDVVERAKAGGITLDRGTVSSLLSRLKREGLLTYNQTEYAIAGLKPTVVASN